MKLLRTLAVVTAVTIIALFNWMCKEDLPTGSDTNNQTDVMCYKVTFRVSDSKGGPRDNVLVGAYISGTTTTYAASTTGCCGFSHGECIMCLPGSTNFFAKCDPTSDPTITEFTVPNEDGLIVNITVP